MSTDGLGQHTLAHEKAQATIASDRENARQRMVSNPNDSDTVMLTDKQMAKVRRGNGGLASVSNADKGKRR